MISNLLNHGWILQLLHSVKDVIDPVKLMVAAAVRIHALPINDVKGFLVRSSLEDFP